MAYNRAYVLVVMGVETIKKGVEMKNTTILAIDPGTTQSAFVWWDGYKIKDFDIRDNNELLKKLRNYPGAVYPHLVIESMVSIWKGAGKETVDTLLWAGRFYEAYSGPKEFIPRYKVRVALCGTMQSKDDSIIAVLKGRFGKPGTKKAPGLTYGLKKDLWQAFALAVTYYDNL